VDATRRAAARLREEQAVLAAKQGGRVELVPAPGMAGGRRGPGDPAGRRDGSVAGGTPERTGIPGVSSCGAQRRICPLVPRVPAARPLRVHLDLAGLPALKFYRVEIVDSSGAPVFEAVSARGEGDLVVETTKPLAAAGVLGPAVRAGPAGALLREFGLRVD